MEVEAGHRSTVSANRTEAGKLTAAKLGGSDPARRFYPDFLSVSFLWAEIAASLRNQRRNATSLTRYEQHLIGRE
jgi:hypothetical protein